MVEGVQHQLANLRLAKDAVHEGRAQCVRGADVSVAIVRATLKLDLSQALLRRPEPLTEVPLLSVAQKLRH